MADATTEFMTALGRRVHDPLLRKVNETLRFELATGKKTDRWLVSIENGDVTVAHKGGEADTVIRADREVFDRMARGEANPVASVLRGELKPAVQRLQKEVAEAGAGGTWITSGYTIENYIDPDVLEAAVREVHPSAAKLSDRRSTADPLAHVTKENGELLERVDKVAVALAATATDADLQILDLKERINELVSFIRASSRELTAVPVAPDVPPASAE